MNGQWRCSRSSNTRSGEAAAATTYCWECTASAKWAINGSELGAGKHEIAVVAIDNAGNETTHYEPISIHHSTPVALGPGSVDLQSGDFSLGFTDVSMGSGLTVSRNYSSRALGEGDEGGLGPQWSLSTGTSESLVELVDHSMMLTDSKGAQTIFASLGENKYESPTGDSNLELGVEENKTTKEKLAYILKNTSANTSVKFTLPSGDPDVWVPTKQGGVVATDTVTYTYRTEHSVEYNLSSGAEPTSIVPGSDGNMWFTDSGSNKIRSSQHRA